MSKGVLEFNSSQLMEPEVLCKSKVQRSKSLTKGVPRASKMANVSVSNASAKSKMSSTVFFSNESKKSKTASPVKADLEAAPVLMQSKKAVKKVSLSQSKPSTPSSKPSTPEETVKKSSPPPPPPPALLPNASYRDRRQCSAPKTERPIKYFTAEESLKDKVAGVVVTIFQGSSYDKMFRETKPTTVPGERVSTYSISCSAVDQLRHHLATLAPLSTVAAISRLPNTALELLHSFLSDDTWRSLVEDIRSVPADSVVFNFECCSGCGNKPFPCADLNCKSSERGFSSTMRFIGFALCKGYTVMCSDFSLKSLIFEWSEDVLGPNPFLQIGSCNSQFCLEFIPPELQHEEVPQQLQVVGELCSEQGKAIVAAMGDTIVYTVNPNRSATDKYSLKVLTVVTDMAQSRIKCNEGMKCAIGSGDSLQSGWAGHVTLTYAAGGQLITSMGHWAELSKIDTSLESVLRVAQMNFGKEESETLKTELATASTEVERTLVIQRCAKTMVSKSAPSRMKGRTKFSKEEE